MYANGSSLNLVAVVKDAAGNIIDGPASGCTPAFESTDSQGVANVDRRVGLVQFGPGSGVFSVAVMCDQNPSITSAGHNEGPFNFETSESVFAKCDQGCEAVRMKAAAEAAAKPATPTTPAPTPSATPAADPDTGSAKKKGMGAGTILLGGALGYLGYKLFLAPSDESSGSSCPSASDLGSASNVCIPDDCDCPTGFTTTGLDYTHCTRTGEHRMCARNSHVALARDGGPGKTQLRTVEDLVAVGLPPTGIAPIGHAAPTIVATTSPVGVKDPRPSPRAELASVVASTRPPHASIAPTPPRAPTPLDGTQRILGLNRGSRTEPGDANRASRIEMGSADLGSRANTVDEAPAPRAAAHGSLRPTSVETSSSLRPPSADTGSRILAIVGAATLSAVAVVSSRYVHLEWRGVEAMPWAEPAGGGLTVGGRF